jgi:hypothetical protein
MKRGSLTEKSWERQVNPKKQLAAATPYHIGIKHGQIRGLSYCPTSLDTVIRKEATLRRPRLLLNIHLKYHAGNSGRLQLCMTITLQLTRQEFRKVIAR